MEIKDDKSDRANIGIMPISVKSSNKLEVLQTSAISEVSPISRGIEIVKTFSSAGIRPITASNLKVVKTMNVMGIRPIGAHTIDIVDSINQCGIRPVAANTINDSESLMAFLD
ncbi:hypothetical protein [Calothrix sp. UHCC 0171]|uniref:hypothetical protein n=1 Tax=Calothrix sp. UHCC 0171 TaxID=3110245 RepID=UPI002B1F3445|nr:hypothetical protein [Calothrix sp. UHCC 0171]MEA5572316.1 hypothetical protein [Calothrix sp. UHCC 0171]